ncbi:LysR family transcriptional regulator [Pseudidiomarina sediminum]|uniref:LysR family transcriptional regulator n=1 Tax=Pseudidiomarina sediminum TaxID=431675 RepID=A0A432Z9N6_9GAMM|nr:LysR family transcriptional regulator [Pseudidiomarina sediminum]MBY6063850.1 LysR family transcriptional regulator [Pseudidiomarina sediminum]RUO74656.1 LysR family transcriptional regulator [Pseudidiomarina sediminum]
MKLSQLEMLILLAEHGSVQQVAEHTHRSQAAVSMALKSLERDVGFRLFDRSGYRLALSPHGQQFVRQAREVVRQQQRLASLAQQLQAGAEPQLRISYDYTCAPSVLFPAIRAMQTAFPATELLLSGDSQLRSLRRVKEGEVELALCPWLPVFLQHGDFESIRVRPFELVAVSTPALISKESLLELQRSHLLDIPMLIPQDQDVGIDLDKIMRLPGQRRIRVNDSITQRELLLAGMGWGIVPKDLVKEALERGALQSIDIPGFMTEVSLEVRLIRSAERIAGPAEEAIWQHFAHRSELRRST